MFTTALALLFLVKMMKRSYDQSFLLIQSTLIIKFNKNFNVKAKKSVFGVADDCPNGWIRHRNRCFLKVDVRESWINALASCEAAGATLITLDYPTTEEANGL